MHAIYKITKSDKYEGLWLLVETVVLDSGVETEGFKAYFETDGEATHHAKSMMYKQEDVLEVS